MKELKKKIEITIKRTVEGVPKNAEEIDEVSRWVTYGFLKESSEGVCKKSHEFLTGIVK